MGLIIFLFIEIFIIFLLTLIGKSYFTLSNIFIENFILIYLYSLPLIMLYALNSLLYNSKNKHLFYLSIFFTVIISILILLIYLILLPFIEGFNF